MAGMWCPSCRSEYREGFTECADCAVALVEHLPEPPDTARRPRPVPSNSPDDDAVELARLPALEADLLASRLHEAGLWAEVPEVWAGGELVGVRFAEGLRVLVRRADLADASAVLADF